MIACNQHGQPSLSPERRQGPMLTLPDLYLDLMFGELPDDIDDAPPAAALAEATLLQI